MNIKHGNSDYIFTSYETYTINMYNFRKISFALELYAILIDFMSKNKVKLNLVYSSKI